MLTAMQVKKAVFKEKTYKLSDANGLYLLVNPNGAKYWRYKYRFNGKEKTYAIGTAQDVSLSEARERHQQARKLVQQGIDPTEQKKSEKIQRQIAADNSFERIAKQWHDAKLNQWDAKHAEKLWRSLELHIFPHFGNQPITDITPRMMLSAIQRLEKAEKTDVSHRVLQRVNAVFVYAISADLADTNPAAELKGALKAHRGKHFPAIKGDELPDFFEKLEQANTSTLNKLAIKLLAHTFVRQCELRKAKWQEFNFEQAMWTVPAENTKMKRVHHVPLAKQTIELLRQIQTVTDDSDYVFPTQNRQKNPYMSEGTITRVLKEMGYKGRMVGHGFRALATTELNEAGFPPDVIERQMQHMEKNKVRAAYHRAEYIDQRREMMEWWTGFIAQNAQGRTSLAA